MNGTKRAERLRAGDTMIARFVQALAEAGEPVRFVEEPPSGDPLPAHGGPWRGNLVTPCGAMLPIVLVGPQGIESWRITVAYYDHKCPSPGHSDLCRIVRRVAPLVASARATHAGKVVAKRLLAPYLPVGTGRVLVQPDHDGSMRFELHATANEAQIQAMLDAATKAGLLTKP